MVVVCITEQTISGLIPSPYFTSATFIGLFEKIHRPPEHPRMLRLQMVQKVLLGIPFLQKKESIFILDTLGEVEALASFFRPYGTAQ
jgi:hypothetical protein